MKGILSVLIFTFLCSEKICSQECKPIVSSNSEVILTNTQRVDTNRFYWVCSGVSFTLIGDTNTLYVEENAIVEIQGDSNHIFQKGNGSIKITGEYNLLEYDTSTSVIWNGTWGGFVYCVEANKRMLVFDYS